MYSTRQDAFRSAGSIFSCVRLNPIVESYATGDWRHASLMPRETGGMPVSRGTNARDCSRLRASEPILDPSRARSNSLTSGQTDPGTLPCEVKSFDQWSNRSLTPPCTSLGGIEGGKQGLRGMGGIPRLDRSRTQGGAGQERDWSRVRGMSGKQFAEIYYPGQVGRTSGYS